jgi:hypothetical protein
MKTNKNTGEQNTETRQELNQKYFGNSKTYQEGNLGMISLMSDIQEMINLYFPKGSKEHYRIILNDLKLILIQEDRVRNDEVEKVLLEGRISDILLRFAETAKEDITTSDLQGIAIVEAKKTITTVREA